MLLLTGRVLNVARVSARFTPRLLTRPPTKAIVHPLASPRLSPVPPSVSQSVSPWHARPGPIQSQSQSNHSQSQSHCLQPDKTNLPYLPSSATTTPNHPRQERESVCAGEPCGCVSPQPRQRDTHRQADGQTDWSHSPRGSSQDGQGPNSRQPNFLSLILPTLASPTIYLPTT